MSRKALVTGGNHHHLSCLEASSNFPTASGLLGRQVLKTFSEAGWTAVGTGLKRAKPPSIIKLDLLNYDELERVLDEVK